MDLQKLFKLREERAQLQEALRIPGVHGLGRSARYAAMNRLREIQAEISEIENPTVVVENPLDTMSLEELKALYEEKKSNLPQGRAVRERSQLLAIDTRIQRLTD